VSFLDILYAGVGLFLAYLAWTYLIARRSARKTTDKAEGNIHRPPPITRGESATQEQPPSVSEAVGSGKTSRQSEDAKLLDYLRGRFGNDPPANSDQAINLIEDLISELQAQYQQETTVVHGSASGGGTPLSETAATMISNGRRALEADDDFLELSKFLGLDETIDSIAANPEWWRDGIDDFSSFVRKREVQTLLRADALVSTYYPANETWHAFRLGLELSSALLREAAQTRRMRLHHALLLVPFESADARADDGDLIRMQRLVPITNTLQQTNFRSTTPRVAIDWPSFGYSDERGVRVVSRYVKYNAHEWRNLAAGEPR